MDLSENVVDVTTIAFLSSSLALFLATATDLASFLSSTLFTFLGYFWSLFGTFWNVRQFVYVNPIGKQYYFQKKYFIDVLSERFALISEIGLNSILAFFGLV